MFTTDTGSCPWSDWLVSFTFEKMTVKYPSLNNHRLSVILSGKYRPPWKQQLVQLVTQTQRVSVRRRSTQCAATCSVGTSHFITQNDKNVGIQELRFNKIIVFYYLMRAIHKWSWLWGFTVRVWWWRAQWQVGQFDALIYAKSLAVLPTVAFASSTQIATQ